MDSKAPEFLDRFQVVYNEHLNWQSSSNEHLPGTIHLAFRPSTIFQLWKIM